MNLFYVLQVANFEYIDEAEAAAEEEARRAAAEARSAMSNSERANYWEELLKDQYEVHKVKEFNALGKGKRSRKQVLLYAPLPYLTQHTWTWFYWCQVFQFTWDERGSNFIFQFFEMESIV